MQSRYRQKMREVGDAQATGCLKAHGRAIARRHGGGKGAGLTTNSRLDAPRHVAAQAGEPEAVAILCGFGQKQRVARITRRTKTIEPGGAPEIKAPRRGRTGRGAEIACCHHPFTRLWHMPSLIALKRKPHPLWGLLRVKSREHHLVQRQAQRIARRSVDCDNPALYGAIVVPAQNRCRDKMGTQGGKTRTQAD